MQPSYEEQELLAETFRRAQARMMARERLAELVASAGFMAAAAAVWLIRPPHAFAALPAAVCLAVMVLATRVRFDTPFGFTVPIQLAFVPLLFALPVALVPFAVVVALAAAWLPDVLSGRMPPIRLWKGVGNAWFAIGPAAVFAVAGTDPSHAGLVLLVAALTAQFIGDFAASVLRFLIARGASISAQLRETWVYVIDAALAGVGLVVAKQMQLTPLAPLVLVPLLGVLAMFAHERHQRLQGLLELNDAYRGTALALGDVVEADDDYTAQHCRSVVGLALAVAEQLGIGADRRRNIEFAALLHDVGKISIPNEIINKPGSLDPHEWMIIKTHTLEGQKLLDRVGGFMRQVGVIVRSHHERWDGNGYPDGLAGEAIPLEARIISCCDTWHAMRTDRVYRAALNYDAALAELLASAGSQLDPEIVDALAKIVAVEPVTVTPEVIASVPMSTTAERRTALWPAPWHGLGVGSSVAAQPEGRADASRDTSDGRWNEVSRVEDARSPDPVERLMEESWEARSRRASRRELLVEGIAAGLFLAIAIPWAIPALVAGQLPLQLTVMLVISYAFVARAIKFPIGAGYVVPSYLVLVPMLLLLPPSTVPLLVAIALVLGSGCRVVAGKGSPQQLLFAVPDAFHALGPAAVLSLAAPVHGVDVAWVYVGAFLAGCLVDLLVSTLRESLALGIAPRLQARVIAAAWLVDACIAPLGLLAAEAARAHSVRLLFVAPLIGLLVIVDRDRRTRIGQAQHRLDLVARERTRLQAAVHRLGDAFAAKLDLRALADVLLGGSIDALDAAAGTVILHQPPSLAVCDTSGAIELEPLLQVAVDASRSTGRPHQLEVDGVWALALPLAFGASGGGGGGALAVARRGRAFRSDEQSLMLGLVERAQRAATEIVAHETLREQAVTDPLTRLGNRRKLSEDLGDRLLTATFETPLLLMLFDLDGFKSYNDTFGHVAGDALLARLGHKLAAAVSPHGSAYRLGGDEFCVLLPARRDQLRDAIAAAAGALHERGETFMVTASCGTVLLPHEARTVDYGLQLADRRMYARKLGRPSGAREQARDVLIHIMQAKQPDLPDHSSGVATLAIPVGRRLGMDDEQLDELARAATLHDVGKVGLPDAILSKPGRLDPEEWSFVREHTVLGERILSAAPALRPVATIVRASHERWDGKGYPDGLRAQQIPLAARIVAVCDAYEAITSDRCYRPARSKELACEELRRESGRQFDPAVVTAFLQELRRPATQPSSDVCPAGTDELASLTAQVVSHVHELLDHEQPRQGECIVCDDSIRAQLDTVAL